MPCGAVGDEVSFVGSQKKVIERQGCHKAFVWVFGIARGGPKQGAWRYERGSLMGARDFAAEGWYHHHKLCELWLIDGCPRFCGEGGSNSF